MLAKVKGTFLIFLSTLSLRRATCFRIPYWFKVTISIHALLAESDVTIRRTVDSIGISIHALLAESDLQSFGIGFATNIISIHALLAESDKRFNALVC